MMWAVGLLSSGLVATLALTYAGQIIMVGLLGIKVGLTMPPYLVVPSGQI